ncbi:MAG: hypothetical protein EOM50_12455 [Erysipelotrichia bacterium]|nr:hypothetical protein [Erysipelotrichia bacterium]NCC54681.1 hypothetical protein [Erysipelotrichia bacterium]
MKKALGVIAVLGSAAALIAYKLKKDEQRNVDYTTMNEDDISERILKTAQEQNFAEDDGESFEEKASTETASYPHLNEDDMVRLNEISEARFAEMEQSEDQRSERPLQHVVVFNEETSLEKYKTIVINEGYVVTSGDEENELVILNITDVNPDAILSKVFYLANLAKEYHGTYVNWILK